MHHNILPDCEKRRELLSNYELLLTYELKLDELQEIGSGMFGRVYSARRSSQDEFAPEDNQLVACKLTDYSDHKFAPIQWKCFIDEVKAFRAINSHKHPHIVQYKSDFHMFVQDNEYVEIDLNGDTFEEEVQFEVNCDNLVQSHWYNRIIISGIIIEKLDMSLSDWMKANKTTRLNEAQGKQLLCEIGSALQFLHCEHYLVHCDLKLNNFGVIGQVQAGAALPTLKLYDFGLARSYDRAQFTAAEQKSSTFSLNDNYTDLKVHDDLQYRNNAFMCEACHFGRTIFDVMTGPNETNHLDRFKEDEHFRKIVFGLATKRVSVNTALDLYKTNK